MPCLDVVSDDDKTCPNAKLHRCELYELWVGLFLIYPLPPVVTIVANIQWVIVSQSPCCH